MHWVDVRCFILLGSAVYPDKIYSILFVAAQLFPLHILFHVSACNSQVLIPRFKCTFCPAACCLLAAVFIECHIKTLKWLSWRNFRLRLGVSSGFRFGLYFTRCKDERWTSFCALGRFVAPWNSHCGCLKVSISSAALFAISVSVGLMYSPQDLDSC